MRTDYYDPYTCTRCGGPAIPLATTTACKAECDLKAKIPPNSLVHGSVWTLQSGEKVTWHDAKHPPTKDDRGYHMYEPHDLPPDSIQHMWIVKDSEQVASIWRGGLVAVGHETTRGKISSLLSSFNSSKPTAAPVWATPPAPAPSNIKTIPPNQLVDGSIWTLQSGERVVWQASHKPPTGLDLGWHMQLPAHKAPPSMAQMWKQGSWSALQVPWRGGLVAPGGNSVPAGHVWVTVTIP